MKVRSFAISSIPLDPEEMQVLNQFKTKVVYLKGLGMSQQQALGEAKAYWSIFRKLWTQGVQEVFDGIWNSGAQKVSIRTTPMFNTPISLDDAKEYFYSENGALREKHLPQFQHDVVWGTFGGFPHIVGNDWTTVCHFETHSDGAIQAVQGWKNPAARSEFWDRALNLQ